MNTCYKDVMNLLNILIPDSHFLPFEVFLIVSMFFVSIFMYPETNHLAKITVNIDKGYTVIMYILCYSLNNYFRGGLAE